jgi:putative transcriptional regulator
VSTTGRAAALLAACALAAVSSHAQATESPERGKLLVAGRELRDPNFRRTVVLLLGYGPDGAMGIVVNRSAEARLADVLDGVEDLATDKDVVFWGGPVSDGEVFVLLRAAEPPAGASRVVGEVQASREIDLLRQLLSRHGATPYRVFVGYAGWGPGQLDVEIERGDWRVLPPAADAVFDAAPDGLWDRLVPRDPSQVARYSSSTGGSARAASSQTRTVAWSSSARR